MNKPDVAKLCKTAHDRVVKYGPEILTGVGIAGMITTTVLAVKATPKALELLEEKKKEEKVEKLAPIETVKACWKPYIPAGVTCAASVACLIGASSANMKRNAAIATAYKLSETALSEYREKVIETVGDKKEQLIRDKVAEERLKNDPVSKKEVIITGKGKSLCYDALSGRYFESDMEKIQKVENAINKRMLSEMYISLNEFYDELGLSRMYPLGDDLGWKLDDGLLEITFSPLLTDDGRPCLALDYNIVPKYDYSKFM